MLIGIWTLRKGFSGTSRKWWTIALVIQFWHHIEHAVLQWQALTHHYWIGSPVPVSFVQMLLPKFRIEIHLFYNAIVFIPMMIAMYYYMEISHKKAQKAQKEAFRLWLSCLVCGPQGSQDVIACGEKWKKGVPLTRHFRLGVLGGVDAVLCQQVELHASGLWIRERLRGLHARQMLFRLCDETFGLIPGAITTENSAAGARVKARRTVVNGNECGDAIREGHFHQNTPDFRLRIFSSESHILRGGR